MSIRNVSKTDSTEIAPITDIPKSVATPPRRKPVFYPEGDGKPMAETPEHREAMTLAIQSLQIALEDVPDVWISGNDFVYFVEGNPSRRVSPDCYVVLGVPRAERRFFKIWEEGGHAPHLVMEFTSPKTAREDQQTKFDLYQDVLKVPEYILFDPLNQYLRPRLQGYRRQNGAYVPMVPDADGRIYSVETGVSFFAEGKLLRVIHPRTGEVIQTRSEAEESRRQEAARAEQEAARADAAEAEVARLRAELARLQQT